MVECQAGTFKADKFPPANIEEDLLLAKESQSLDAAIPQLRVPLSNYLSYKATAAPNPSILYLTITPRLL
jgi:hypothetical protein